LVRDKADGHDQLFLRLLDAEMRPSVADETPFKRLPDGFWNKARPRLEQKGLPVSGYVPCEKLGRKRDSGGVIIKATGKRAVVYVITGFHWRGDQRLLVSWTREVAPLASSGGTLALELKEGQWVVVAKITSWISWMSHPSHQPTAESTA
jgi:hypothetical protein